jgi:hypothetical protein
MTFCNRTPQTRTVSTPATTDAFRYRYGAIEMPVLEDPRLTQNDKTVYATLKAHRNHRSGVAWPSRRTIGQIAGCTERAVSLATARLLDAGYLTKEARVGRSTVYGFPLAPPATPADAFRGTPERAFTDKIKFEHKKTEPQPQQPAHERPGGSVVVVDCFHSKPGTPAILIAPEPEPAPIPAIPASCVTQEPAPIPALAINPAEPTTPEPSTPAEPAPCTIQEPAIPAESAPATPAEPDPEPSTPATTPAESKLSFPAIISLAMQAGIVRILCGLPYADAQMLLDELAGAAQATAIRNPIAYLRRLLSLHLAGTLIPEHAERIAALRAAQARNEAARQRALNMRPGERPPDTPKPTKPRDHSAREAAMAAMRAKLLSP